MLGRGDAITLSELANRSVPDLIYLLVLSACDTALPISTDDGLRVEGAATRLLKAGITRSVVGSLWPVSDASTAIFMSRLYELIASGLPGSKSEALAQVQREFVAGRARAGIRDLPGQNALASKTAQIMRPGEWMKPKYWAPFVLVGSVR